MLATVLRILYFSHNKLGQCFITVNTSSIDEKVETLNNPDILFNYVDSSLMSDHYRFDCFSFDITIDFVDSEETYL